MLVGIGVRFRFKVGDFSSPPGGGRWGGAGLEVTGSPTPTLVVEGVQPDALQTHTEWGGGKDPGNSSKCLF